MSAFQPLPAAKATTQALVVGTTASSLPLAFAPSGVVPTGLSICLYANGPSPVFVSFTGTAVIPVAGTPQEGVWVPAGLPVVLTAPTDSTVTLSAIAAATGTTLYVTQGYGQ